MIVTFYDSRDKFHTLYWHRGYKTFFMFNSTEHEIYFAHNVKMPTVVGILTFISMINTTYETLEASKKLLHLSVF